VQYIFLFAEKVAHYLDNQLFFHALNRKVFVVVGFFFALVVTIKPGLFGA
jgi:hypothetical protein